MVFCFLHFNEYFFIIGFLAGIMFGPRRETVDGFEQQFATNHLGHFLLTHILMSKLKQAGTAESHARVINVSSAAHWCGMWTAFDDLQSR